MNLPSNIRVASWLGSECLKAFIAKNKLSDERLEKFRNQLASLPYVEDVPAWDNETNNLEITGLGDPLPEELSHVRNLFSLVETVREISASQIYGAFQPDEVTVLLEQALKLSELDLQHYSLSKMREVPAGLDGFGGPLSPNDVQGFEH